MIDSFNNSGAEKVSSYLKERKVVRYVKNNVSDEIDLIDYEGKVIDASPKLLNAFYERMVSNSNISLEELFAPLKSI